MSGLFLLSSPTPALYFSWSEVSSLASESLALVVSAFAHAAPRWPLWSLGKVLVLFPGIRPPQGVRAWPLSKVGDRTPYVLQRQGSAQFGSELMGYFLYTTMYGLHGALRWSLGYSCF